MSGASLDILKRVMKGKSAKWLKYPLELKSFALTLPFYSAKAYEFVWRTFNEALPHQSNIRRWYSTIPADPGFTQASFQAIRIKVEEAAQVGTQVVCSLMLDEMSIKKHVSWDGTRFRGYVGMEQMMICLLLPKMPLSSWSSI